MKNFNHRGAEEEEFCMEGFVVDKLIGLTSHDVVGMMRRALGFLDASFLPEGMKGEEHEEI